MLEVQEQLGNSIALVSPSRELLTRARLMKISSSTNKVEERFLFVFNDLILLTSERTIGIGGKYKLRAIFDAFYTQVGGRVGANRVTSSPFRYAKATTWNASTLSTCEAPTAPVGRRAASNSTAVRKAKRKISSTKSGPSSAKCIPGRARFPPQRRYVL